MSVRMYVCVCLYISIYLSIYIYFYFFWIDADTRSRTQYLTCVCVLHILFPRQVILLEEAWAELFLLCAIQWSMPMDVCPLFGLPEHAPNSHNGKISPFSDMRILQEVMTRFKVVQVDPAEFACLKAIVLFKSGQLCVCG